MCGVTQKSCNVSLLEGQRVAPELEQKPRNDQSANGDKDQGMSEMAVILKEKQRVRARLNKYVQVWRHAREGAKYGKGPQIFRF